MPRLGAMNWYDRYARWSDSHRGAVDLLVTAALLVVVVPASSALTGSGFDTVSGSSSELHALVAFALIAPLALRRTHPALSAVLVYSVALVHMVVLGIPMVFPADLFVLVSLFSVTVYGPRWAHRVAIASSAVGCFILGALIGQDTDMIIAIMATTTVAGSMFLATWAFGLVRRARRDTIGALRDRALRLEIERDQQVQLATAAERARIAREMHDIVAHSLSVMIAQADGGRYMAATDPDAAARTLGTIAETGRAALADMRRLLGVLRNDPTGSPTAPGDPRAPSADLTPQPAASDIETLVSQVRASGLRVSLVRMGVARTLPPGTGLTLYRICQEALTNILKHAGPDPTVTVVLGWGANSVQLQVDDDGRGASAGSDGGGHGLLGMRERAAMFGGTIVSGPRPGGGFRVMLDLPLPAQRTGP